MSEVAGRYTLHAVFASGGMATVHFGRLRGAVGFARIVAIKRLLPQYASDPEFVAMFVDEARLASRIRHPNVVPTLDVVSEDGDLSIVMEYVHGETLSRLIHCSVQAQSPIAPSVGCRIVHDMLAGLHAAHEAKDERGAGLGIVHRDVSPQNVMVGVDGIARLLDFGIARARGRSQVTREGQVKGKLSYMSPEQLMGRATTRAVDIFAAAVVLWEVLVGRRLFQGDSEGQVVHRIIEGDVPLPSAARPELGERFDAVVMQGLSPDPEQRFATARDFAQALSEVVPLADAAVVGEAVSKLAAANLAWRSERLAEVERESSGRMPASNQAALALEPPGTGTSATRAVVTEPARVMTSASSSRWHASRVTLIFAGVATMVATIAIVRPAPTPTVPKVELVASQRPSDALVEPLPPPPTAPLAEASGASSSSSTPVDASSPAVSSASASRGTAPTLPIAPPTGRRMPKPTPPAPRAPFIPNRL